MGQIPHVPTLPAWLCGWWPLVDTPSTCAVVTRDSELRTLLYKQTGLGRGGIRNKTPR